MEAGCGAANEGDALAGSVDVEHEPTDEPRFAAIVYLRGEHDMVTTPQVSDAISKTSGSVLVDLSDCDFIDSTVIDALFDHARSITKSGSVLEIVAPTTSNVSRILQIVQMHKLVPVHPGRPTPDPKPSIPA